MATKTIKIYECDICHSQFSKSSELSSCSLPINSCVTSSSSIDSIIIKNVDICDECKRMLYKVIRDKYAEINLTIKGLSAEKKFNDGVRVRKILNEGT